MNQLVGVNSRQEMETFTIWQWQGLWCFRRQIGWYCQYTEILENFDQGVEDDEDMDLMNLTDFQDSMLEGDDDFASGGQQEWNWLRAIHVDHCQVWGPYYLLETATPMAVKALSPGSPIVVDDYESRPGMQQFPRTNCFSVPLKDFLRTTKTKDWNKKRPIQ